MKEQSPSIPADPALEEERARAQADLAGALQTQTQGDMASLMARYGTQLALAGGSQSPLVSSRTGGIGAPLARAA